MPEFLACADFLAAVAVQLGQKICQRPLNTGISGIAGKMFSPGTSKPTSGYTVHSDSYLYRGPFGQVDAFIHISAGALQNQEHTIGFVGEGYRPAKMREISGSIIKQDGTYLRQITCRIYPSGEIKVISPYATDTYIFFGIGSYFIG